ncbi:hypothetical protein CASFOL_014157 [Castilleja foliolosa]|uniref:Late embryogenesis abundant protein LEA-2 subgroup domain-containing protein n=1 Tax=Castilleja foliolosa TaxID=1961234 RepID=A0ABD3DNX5_9LAMI
MLLGIILFVYCYCLALFICLIPHNPRFRISNANFPVQNNSMIFDLEFSNPNVATVYFSVINLELVGIDGDVVGTNFTPGFIQGCKDKTLKIVINAVQIFWQGGDVDFMVRVKTDVKFRVIRWTSKVHRVIYEERFRYVNIKNI